MSRIIIPVQDKDGNKAYFATSEHEGKELVENYEGYLIFLQKEGFKLSKGRGSAEDNEAVGSSARRDAAKSASSKPPSSDKKFCHECGEEMKYKEGFSKKTNKPWKAYFCPNNHEPVWL